MKHVCVCTKPIKIWDLEVSEEEIIDLPKKFENFNKIQSFYNLLN